MTKPKPAYYNEIDEYAARWLRNLIAAGHIADGVVDTRSIEDVRPDDLREFGQCHFFAGIGVWSLALRRAGWPDDRPVWTGSCPCQPFSSAGKGAGFSDERHLWPAFHWLIQERRPAVVYGEQVASSDVGPWLDLVQADLEALDYALGCIAFPSAGVGAPHIRDRLFWMADARSGRREAVGQRGSLARARRGEGGARHPSSPASEHHRGPGQLGDAERIGPQGRGHSGIGQGMGEARAQPAGAVAAGRVEHPDDGGDRPQEPAADHRQPQADRPADLAGGSGIPPRGLAYVPSQGRRLNGPDGHTADLAEALRVGAPQPGRGGAADGAGPTNGLWAAADWLLCRDGRWRAVEPGTFPLAHGAPARVGRLRAYGNAINAEAARIFIEATM